MRTTVTLDPDTEALLRRVMSERGISFKQALNDAIRRGTAASPSGVGRTTVHDLGAPKVDLDRALQLVDERPASISKQEFVALLTGRRANPGLRDDPAQLNEAEDLGPLS